MESIPGSKLDIGFVYQTNKGSERSAVQWSFKKNVLNRMLEMNNTRFM